MIIIIFFLFVIIANSHRPHLKFLYSLLLFYTSHFPFQSHRVQECTCYVGHYESKKHFEAGGEFVALQRSPHAGNTARAGGKLCHKAQGRMLPLGAVVGRWGNEGDQVGWGRLKRSPYVKSRVWTLGVRRCPCSQRFYVDLCEVHVIEGFVWT